MRIKKWTTKQWLLLVPYFLLYLLYFFMSAKERTEYLKAQERGYDCTGSYDSSRFLYGSYTTYEFDRSKPPTRRYVTWSEFWKQKGY